MDLFLIWIILSFIIAFFGTEKKIGFWGTFFISLLLSPLIGLIVALLSPSNMGSSENIGGSKSFVKAGIYRKNGDIPKAIQFMNWSLESNPTNPLSHYNLATYYSLSHNKEDAFKSLSKSIELGFDNFDKLRNDPDLQWLRNQEEYDEFEANGYTRNPYHLRHKSTPPSNYLRDLKELGELRDKKIITEEEFLEQKARILRSR